MKRSMTRRLRQQASVRKAEAYWKTRVWLMNGGILMKSKKWKQLNWIQYKVSSDKQLQIQLKEEWKKERG